MVRSRILVVDDDNDVRESLVDELCANYDVESVASGREAIVCLHSNNYDAVISDFRMPDVNGIEVLEWARQRDPEMVRILLTGHLDPEAQKQTQLPGAPFKVGKPWHDEIEVILRRAFEFREAMRRLSGSVLDALAVAGVDDELGAADGLHALAEVLAKRVAKVQGVDGCVVTLDLPGKTRVLAGAEWDDGDECGRADWTLEAPISADGTAKVKVRGSGDNTREIVRFLAQRARRWCSEDQAVRLARKASADPKVRKRLNTVSRWASLGAMTASLVHDLASVVQGLQGSIHELEFVVREAAADDPEIIESLDAVNEMSKRMLSLFRAMRTFVRSRDINHRRCQVADLVERTVALCKGHLQSRATLRIGEIPEAHVDVSEPLFLQVLVNVLRNAADASPDNGFIDLAVSVHKEVVAFSVTDDGPGVLGEIADALFEPFVTTKPENSGCGLGLAVSSQIVADHGGSIHYERAPGRGARFVVSIPSAAEAAPPVLEIVE